MPDAPNDTIPLRIGHMPYTNSLIFYARMPSDEVDLVTLPPRNMADAMRRGQLDAGPLPIYEVFKLMPQVVPVGNYGVATMGPAHSVLLFSQVACDQLSGKTVAVTSHTSTSVQLLRILMADLWRVTDVELAEPDRECDAKLLIGDEAMRYGRAQSAARERYRFVYDLGEEWLRLTGLPFVFARWVARANVDVDRIHKLLRSSFEYGVARVEELARSVAVEGYSASEVHDYIASFAYELGEDEVAAIEEFRIRLENLPVWEPPVMPYISDNDSTAEVAQA